MFRSAVSIDTDKLDCLPAVVGDILTHPDRFSAKIDKMLSNYFFNPGHAGEVAGKYILETLINRKKGNQS